MHIIPRFIVHQDLQENRRGTFPGAVIFLDISGFTAMTEALMVHGKAGAEQLSGIINSVFAPLLDIVYAHGGFVSTFAGDAFTVVFESKDQDGGVEKSAAACAGELSAYFYHNPLHTTPWGEFQLKVKIGIGGGEIQWRIFTGDGGKGYLFRGPALDQAAAAEKLCRAGEVVVGPGARVSSSRRAEPRGSGPADRNSAVSEEELAGGFLRLTHNFTGAERTEETPLSGETREALQASPSPEQLEDFAPIRFFPDNDRGEFRDITSVFISYDESVLNPTAAFTAVSRQARMFGGYISMVDSGDKGGVVLVLFGAPAATENNARRALDFTLALRSEDSGNSFRMGVASGRAFTGYVGAPLRKTYTALGRVVNLSARLAMAGNEGSILIPDETAGKFRDQYDFEPSGSRSFKGFDRAMEISSLQKQKKQSGVSHERLIGRDEEFTVLSSFLDRLGRGESFGAVSIEGEAGIGKTALLESLWKEPREATSKLQRLDFSFTSLVKRYMEPLKEQLLKEFRASREDQASGWVQGLQQSMMDEHTPDYLRNEFVRSREPLLSLMGFLDENDDYYQLDSQARHGRNLEALVAYYSLKSMQTPLLLVADSADTMDEGSHEFFDRLLSRSQDLPLSVLFLSRRHDFLSTLTIPAKHNLELKPLNREQIQEFVKERTSARGDESYNSFIQARSAGVPLFIEELLRFLDEKNLVYRRGGYLKLKDFDMGIMPGNIEALILSRIDRLPAGLRNLLPYMAVLGQRFDGRVLKNMLSEALGTGLAANLRELERRGIVHRDNEQFWVFHTPLLRDSLYQLQFDEQLQKLHSSAAEAYTLLHPKKPDYSAEKATHYAKAGENQRAVEYFKLAGTQAMQNYQNEAALSYFNNVLSASRSDGERSRIHLEKARIFELTGDWNAAKGELERGLGVATIAGENELYHRFFSMLGQISYRKGDAVSAGEYLEKALQDPGYREITREKVNVRIELAKNHMREGQYAEALTRLFEARDIAVEKSYRLEEGQVLYYMGQVYNRTGKVEQAVNMYEESRKIFQELNAVRELSNPMYDLSQIHMSRGALDKAEEGFRSILQSYSQIGYKSGLAAALVNMGSIKDQQGAFDEAIDFFRRSRHIAREIEEAPAVGWAQFAMGASAYKKHEYPQALSYLQDAYRIFQEIGLKSYYGYPLAYLIAAHVRMDNPDRALELGVELVRLNQILGHDAERGRIFLALGELLEKSGLPPQNGLKQIKYIARLSGLKFISPAAFYAKAVKESRQPKYLNTYIPALYAYGTYLLKTAHKQQPRPDEQPKERPEERPEKQPKNQTGKQKAAEDGVRVRERGEGFIRQAYRETRQAQWHSFSHRIESEQGAIISVDSVDSVDSAADSSTDSSTDAAAASR
ncbi:tetratricopeptide repeat protein [Salinispira pacifica]|uniref:Guanylate cyclase domain-containing protein n=1 Tax=Salinispira pacifica TaxID=1307761 RepID=V5WFN3_9SPIO|nr:tetratricopeptide repeat protein [Salinispira pacifica]AHC13981.1 hypothetical protein L21SP2_0549 [Salinispira pacifica]